MFKHTKYQVLLSVFYRIFEHVTFLLLARLQAHQFQPIILMASKDTSAFSIVLNEDNSRKTQSFYSLDLHFDYWVKFQSTSKPCDIK